MFHEKGFKSYLLKRIIALEGDSVEIKKGLIYVNGLRITGKFSNDEIPEDKNKMTVPKDCVWVIGDNRSLSWYGLVKIENIVGTVNNKDC